MNFLCRLRVKEESKIMERNSKQGSFVTSRFVVKSEDKIISIGGILKHFKCQV